MMADKIILYGAGKDGLSALNYLGKDNILCFCDNSKYKDVFLGGIPIKTFENIMNDYNGEMFIITASSAKSVYEITRQLLNAKVEFDLFDCYVEERIREDALRYSRLNDKHRSFDYKSENEYLIARDKGKDAGNLGSYFWQDLWAAKHIYKAKPNIHFDIGSRVDGFIAHLLSFGQKVKQIDIRPLQTRIDGWEFVQSDATLLENIPDGSIESLSALCSLEHFGLGRYGDNIDPDACFKCFKAIQKKLVHRGAAYISVPISGYEHLEFNAHRVFDPITIVKEFNELSLVDFSAAENENYYDNVDLHYFESYKKTGGRLFGLFRFEKR